MVAQRLEDRRCKWVLRAPGGKRQDTEHPPRYQPPLASSCQRTLTVLWPTSFTLLTPSHQYPSQRMFGTHWRRPSWPTSRSLCKLLICVHHVPDTPGGAVPAQDTQQGKEKQHCASSVPGKELLRVRSLFPAPSPVPTLFGLLSAGGRNRWVQPESKCSPLGLSVAEIRMRPWVLTQHHGWSWGEVVQSRGQSDQRPMWALGGASLTFRVSMK